LSLDPGGKTLAGGGPAGCRESSSSEDERRVTTLVRAADLLVHALVSIFLLASSPRPPPSTPSPPRMPGILLLQESPPPPPPRRETASFGNIISSSSASSLTSPSSLSLARSALSWCPFWTCSLTRRGSCGGPGWGPGFGRTKSSRCGSIAAKRCCDSCAMGIDSQGSTPAQTDYPSSPSSVSLASPLSPRPSAVFSATPPRDRNRRASRPPTLTNLCTTPVHSHSVEKQRRHRSKYRVRAAWSRCERRPLAPALVPVPSPVKAPVALALLPVNLLGSRSLQAFLIIALIASALGAGWRGALPVCIDVVFYGAQCSSGRESQRVSRGVLESRHGVSAQACITHVQTVQTVYATVPRGGSGGARPKFGTCDGSSNQSTPSLAEPRPWTRDRIPPTRDPRTRKDIAHYLGIE